MSALKKVTPASAFEKELLTAILNKYKNIVESKKNDSAAIFKKKATWQKVTEDFNSTIGVTKRNTEQLRKLWENLKSRAKKEVAKQIRECKKTGGGTAEVVMEHGLSQVLSIVPTQIIPPVNDLDEDADPLEFSQCMATEISEVLPPKENHHIPPSSSSLHPAVEVKCHEGSNTCAFSPVDENFIPSAAKCTGLSTPTVRRKNVFSKEIWEWEREEHELRMKILNEKLIQQQEEHKRRMECIEELHAAQMVKIVKDS